MKIVLLSMNFAPELTGIGKYSGEMADALVKRGHDVTVVCTPPYYPQWVLQAGHRAGVYSTEHPQEGLTVIRCPVWIPKRVRGVTRLVHLMSFAVSSFPVLLWLSLWRPAIFLVVVPALFSAPGGLIAAQLCGARTWLHVQDLELDAAFELGMLKGRWLRGTARSMERLLMRAFDVTSTISRRMLRQLAAKGVTLDRTELLPNWVDLGVVRPSGPSPVLRTSLGIGSDVFVCLFSGTINRKQGLGVLIDAARLLADRSNILILICGHGELRKSLEGDASELDNVRFIDLRPAEELNELLNLADVHLLPQLRDAADLVMPSKLSGMLASGRPVIAAALRGTEIAAVLDGCGIVTDPESAEGFASAITHLAADSQECNRLGAAGRAFAERMLGSESLFDKLDSRMQALCAEPEAEPVPMRSSVGP